MAVIGEPLAFLERVMELSGVVSIRPDWRPWYYRPISVLAHMIIMDSFISSTVFVLSDELFFNKLETSQYAISLVHIAAKYINLHYNTTPYRRMVATAKDFWEDAKLRPEHHGLLVTIYEETNTTVRNILLLFAAAVPTAAIMTGLYNLQVEPEKMKTLYMVADPVPDDSWYWTSCLFEATHMGGVLMNVSVYTAALYSHCLQASGQMRILRAMLESDDMDVNSCIVLHQKILRYVNEIQDYFTGQMFLDVLLSALQNSMCCYGVLKLASNGDLKAISAASILILCMTGTFIMCRSGHIVTASSEKVFESAYQNKWYKMNNRDRRSLALLSTMASKTVRLHYKRLLDFNMETFSGVVQATYSYITLLNGSDAT